MPVHAAFEQMDEKQVYKALDSSANGLGQTQAEMRLREFGPNKLVAKQKTSAITMFLGQLKSTLLILMLIAAALDLYLGEMTDATVLIVIVILNATIGFMQEYKAEKIVDSLQKFLVPKARVIRDGEEKEVEAIELVPGDYVILEEGDAVPADIRLIKENNLLTNDFSLTGESDPKNKFTHSLSHPVDLPERDNQAYLGTTVARGNAQGVIIATGMNTEIGRIAQLSQNTVTHLTPLQKEMNSLAKTLTWIAGIMTVILFLLSYKFLLPKEAFVLAVGVAASAVPEGLPAQVSIALSLGVKRLAKKLALVKKLSAVETLGSTTVICTDKTGTLTAGQMTVQRFWTSDSLYSVSGIGYKPEGDINCLAGNLSKQRLKEFLLTGPLASTGDVRPPDEEHDGWYCMGDPTEGAMITLALKHGLNPEEIGKERKEIRQFPFDSVRKMMSSVRETETGLMLYAKGATDSILRHCSDIETEDGTERLTDSLKKEIVKAVENAAKEGLRVLAYARRKLDSEPDNMADAEQNMTLVGFVAMIDPPREAVPDALRAAKTAGIRTYVLTGDSIVTATTIARKIGLIKDDEDPIAIKGENLHMLDDDELLKILHEPTALFCRVSPEDKLRIVDLLKANSEIVAVTGDGVNDAPALKSAAIGVAMGKTGTDVSKGAADIILLDDSFATLVDAVREGRTIYQNLKKTVLSSMTSNGGELSAVLLGFILMSFGFPAPIIAVQILAVDLLAEMAPLSLLTLDPASRGIMKQPPRDRSEHLLNKSELIPVALWGVFMGLIAVINYYIFLKLNGAGSSVLLESLHEDSGEGALLYTKATTITYLSIGFTQYANILSRRWKRSVFSKQTLKNPSVIISMVITMGLVAVLISTPVGAYLGLSPVGWLGWAIVTGGGLVYLLAWEINKQILKHKTAQ